MRAMAEEPGAAAEDVEGEVGEDAVVEVVGQLGIVQLGEVHPERGPLHVRTAFAMAGPHRIRCARECIAVDSRRRQEVISDPLRHLSVLWMPGARHGQLEEHARVLAIAVVPGRRYRR